MPAITTWSQVCIRAHEQAIRFSSANRHTRTHYRALLIVGVAGRVFQQRRVAIDARYLDSDIDISLPPVPIWITNRGYSAFRPIWQNRHPVVIAGRHTLIVVQFRPSPYKNWRKVNRWKAITVIWRWAQSKTQNNPSAQPPFLLLITAASPFRYNSHIRNGAW